MMQTHTQTHDHTHPKPMSGDRRLDSKISRIAAIPDTLREFARDTGVFDPGGWAAVTGEVVAE